MFPTDLSDDTDALSIFFALRSSRLSRFFWIRFVDYWKSVEERNKIFKVELSKDNQPFDHFNYIWKKQL